MWRDRLRLAARPHSCSLTFDAPRLGLSRATGGSSASTERDGIVGNSILERFVVTFDYRHLTVYLERPPR